MNTFIPIQKNLLITPSNFFDSKNIDKEFKALNNFISETFKISLRHDHFSSPGGMYLAPYIDRRVGYFKDSSITEGGFIRGWTFDELMYKLCAMIIGERSLHLVSSDWKDLYTMLYLVDKKEIRAFAHFHSDEGFATGTPKCRSCGSHWPLS